MKIRKLKKGFTIVELVIVIAVIAILTAILVPTFINISKKANQASDQSFKNYLNKALALVENDPELNTNGENVTMHYAIEDLNAYGIALNKIVTKSDEKLVWKLSENRFYFEREIAESDKLGCWKIQNSVEANQKFSVYAGEGFGTTAEVDGVGFDAGYKDNIQSISYSNSGSSKTVIIRTASANTTLSVNAEHDTIKHYGPLGSLNVIKANTASYHEFGKVAYAEISYGRIVLESGSDIEEIHINSKDDSSFDTVIISNNGGEEELPDRITRDAVTVTEETLVVTVESNGSSENVYVYADGGTGTKGSTQQVIDPSNPENNQNANVNSALGQLVLDNGSEGDKAQTADEKEAAKEAVVEEAIIEEIEEDDKYVARIGTKPYETLKAAVAGAVANDVIEMTANDLSTEALSVNKEIVINMNDHSYAGTIVVATAKNKPVTINGNAVVDAVVKNGNRYYPNLYVSGSGTYALLKDFSMTGTTINYGINYVLDLGGHTLTMTYGGSDGAFEVKKDIYDGVGKLTIRNGNLNFTSTSSSANAFEIYGELTLDNVNINSSCGNACIKGEGGTYSQNCAITITNSTINSAGHGVHYSSYKSGPSSFISTLTMSGSSITASKIGVYANGASCSIENSSIESLASNAIQTVSSYPASGLAASVTISGTSSLVSQSSNTIDCKSGTMQISGNVSVSGTNVCVYVQSASLTIAGGVYHGNFSLGGSGQLTIAGGTFNGNLINVTQAGRLLVIGETQFDELTTYSITGSNGSYEVVPANS